MLLANIWLFPVTVAVLVPSTFILTYIIAVWNEHAQAIFPYISDTGAFPPESCIFGQLLNIAALLMGLVMYLRHRQIAEFHRHAKQSNRWFLCTSTIFLWVGYISAFGVSMVANFQEPNLLPAHILGAVLAFAVGLIYCWSQTVFTYLMKPVMYGRWVAHLRLSLVLTASACFFLMFAFGFYPSGEASHRNITGICKGDMNFIKPGHPLGPVPQVLRGYNIFLDLSFILLVSTFLEFISFWFLSISVSTVELNPRKYNFRGPEGYEDHLVTTACEWLMTFAFVMYFMTYAVELRQAVLVPPKLILTVDTSKLPKDTDYYCRSELTDYQDKSASGAALPSESAESTSGKPLFSRTILRSSSSVLDDLDEQVKLTKNIRKSSLGAIISVTNT